MAELIKVNAPVRKPLFEGVQGENEARSIQFDITPWVEELGDGAVTATAKRSQDSQPYPVTVTRDGTTVTWKPTSTDTAFAGVGSFQLEYTVDDVLAKTRIWSTMVVPSLDPAGDPPDPYDNWLAEMRQIAADAIQAAQDADESADDAQAEVYEAEAWAKGTKNGTPVSSSDAQYQNNSKYFAEESYKNAEAWAVGQRGGVDVPSTDPTYENNSKYWAEQSLANQYGAYIVKSASGDIASFNDGGDDVPMKSLNVTITPKQSGSGDPSPTNVRPITGWTDADIKQRGKNLFAKLASATTDAGVTFTPNADGSVALTGTSTSAAAADTTGYLTAKELGLDPNKRYVLTGGSADIWVGLFAQIGSNIWDTDPVNGKVFTPSATDKYRLVIYVRTSGIVTNTTVYPMIREEGTDATFEAYTPKTTSVPLGQTVYGGTVDVGTGVLTITKRALTGSDIVVTAVGTNSAGNKWADITASGLDAGTVVLCDKYKQVYGSTPESNVFVVYTNAITVVDNRFTDVATAQNLLRTENTILVYNRQTPQTVQLTPAQVASLLGTNNVWSDAGSVEVEYRADPTLAYAELEALILENI